MKTNYVLYWILTAFFLLAAVAYGLWSYLDNPTSFAAPDGQYHEGFWVGMVAITLSAFLTGFIAFYLQMVNRRLEGQQLAEDREDALIDDGEAEQGFFSPWSWWPIVLAGALALLFVGMAVGVWVAFYALPLVLISVVGWTYEYSRGYFGH